MSEPDTDSGLRQCFIADDQLVIFDQLWLVIRRPEGYGFFYEDGAFYHHWYSNHPEELFTALAASGKFLRLGNEACVAYDQIRSLYGTIEQINSVEKLLIRLITRHKMMSDWPQIELVGRNQVDFLALAEEVRRVRQLTAPVSAITELKPRDDLTT